MLAEASNSWHFDALALARLTENKPLSTLGMYLFKHLGLIQCFHLDADKLRCFFTEIEHGYDDSNQYHNRAHAASVLHAMHALLEHGNILKMALPAFQKESSSSSRHGHLERMACLVAAAIHDFDHLGLSNDFLVRVRHERAVRYNDSHVNENHHVAAAYAVLNKPECNFLAVLPHADWQRLRRMVIDLVLSTDMANGGKIASSFKDAYGVSTEGFVASRSEPASAAEAMLLLQMAMKCADLGHLALDWRLHSQWVSRLEEEFFAQGDEEKRLGHSVSFLMDRDQPGCSKTQTGFFEFVVLPLFRSLVSVVSDAQPVLAAVVDNYGAWQVKEGRDQKSVEEEQKVQVTPVSEVAFSSAPSEAPQARKKRSGRARQRAAKYWASVRRRTPSPEYAVRRHPSNECVEPCRLPSSSSI